MSIVRNMLPKTFGLIIDGWSQDSEHYLAIFAKFVRKSGGSEIVEEVLLSCAVQEDVDESTEFVEDLDDDDKLFGFTAADIFDMICTSLVGNYEREDINVDTFSQFIEFISGDNCSTNRKLCKDAGVPFNHRLNLAVEEFIGPDEKDNKRGFITQQDSS